jgi:hypothetical protein
MTALGTEILMVFASRVRPQNEQTWFSVGVEMLPPYLELDFISFGEMMLSTNPYSLASSADIK